jgi:nucleoside-diphosphate-sugar epimerase
MKIALTGATGFVGTHVLAELERRAISPVILARDPQVVSGKHQVVAMDLKNPPADAFERLGRPEVLVHLAWGGLRNFRSPLHFEEELPAHYRFLRSLLDAGLRSLVVTGTCLEYGMQSGALGEDMPVAPTLAYPYAKNALRWQLQYRQSTAPFELTWGRLFYVYGEGQMESALLVQLRQAVERGDRVFNMSRGEQLRDYVHVTDVARDLVALALTGKGHGVVNICSGRPVSVRSLVEETIARNNWSIGLNLGHYPYPDYEPLAFWGDRRKLAALTAQPS